MEFTQYKCPVCDKSFKQGDDVVVCPECGAPHHRDCYEKNGHCFYEDKHSEAFSFEEIYNEYNKTAENDEANNLTACPKCGEGNPKAAFYCNKCGYPLSSSAGTEGNAQNGQDRQQNTNEQPFGGIPPFGVGGVNFQFDPMAGINSSEPIADNVSAGEMAKFVGKNTPYFMIVFNRIKKFGSSRFNFAAFLFSGVYFFYRKMIAVGIIISLLVAALTASEAFIQMMPEYRNIVDSLINTSNGAQMFYSFSLSALSSEFTASEIWFLYSPYILSLFKGAIMLICGFTANRAYYKYCTKKINFIKTDTPEDIVNKELETCGGVNPALAICFEAALMIISYIPLFFQL